MLVGNNTGMRDLITLVEQAAEPTVAYHGTSQRTWDQATDDNTLFLATTASNAESYAQRTYENTYDYETYSEDESGQWPYDIGNPMILVTFQVTDLKAGRC